MAIADDGELVILAPGVAGFGEDEEIDRLIRRYGYRTTPQIMKYLEEEDDLEANLSAAAHLIHGSSEGRFKVTYCPGQLSPEEIESVGFQFGSVTEMSAKYLPDDMQTGWHTTKGGESYYFINNPALGLWAAE